MIKNDFKTWDELVQFQREHGLKLMWCIYRAVALGIPIPLKYRYLKRYIGKGYD